MLTRTSYVLALVFYPPREAGEVASEARRRGLAQRFFDYASQDPSVTRCTPDTKFT